MADADPQMSSSEPMFRSAKLSFPLDMESLASWLVVRGMTVDTRIEPRQFSGGVGNFNYLIVVDRKPAVLRRPPPGPRPAGANDMAREFKVLDGLAAHYALAPKALAVCEDETVIGAPFLLSEYRDGRVIRGSTFVGDAGQCQAIGEMMIGCLADLHRIVPKRVGLQDLGKPKGFAIRTAKGWRKRADAASGGESSPAFAEVADWLEANAPPDTSNPNLLHNDFKLDNIIVDPVDPARARAILDWDQATIGEPLFDLATLLSYWTSPGDPLAMQALNQMPTAQPGFPSRRDAVALYERQSGLDVTNIVYFRALAQFKLAVVVLQLHARWKAAPQHFPEFASLDRVAEGLAHFTQDIIEERTF